MSNECVGKRWEGIYEISSLIYMYIKVYSMHATYFDGRHYALCFIFQQDRQLLTGCLTGPRSSVVRGRVNPQGCSTGTRKTIDRQINWEIVRYGLMDFIWIPITKRIDCNNMNAKDNRTQLIWPMPTYVSVLILIALCVHLSRHFPPWNNSILQKSKIACVTTTFILMCWFLKHALRSKESRLYLIPVSLIGSHSLV